MRRLLILTLILTLALPLTIAAAEKTCIMFGDSISAMHTGEYRLENVLKAQLEAADPGTTWTMYNVSQGGEWIGPGTAQEGVAVPLFDTADSGKYFSVTASHTAADFIFIQYGANDSKVYSPDGFKMHLAALCDRLATDYPGAVIILATSMYLDYDGPYWIDPSWVTAYVPGTSTRNDYLAPYFEATRTLAAERGYILADVCERIEAEVNAGNADLYIGAGDIHPNYDGTAVIADVYCDALGTGGGAEAEIALADAYDDAWETAWVSHLRTLYEHTVPGGGTVPKTDGFVIHLGDSITYADEYGWVNRYGVSDASFQAIITWAKGGGIDSGDAADNKNGWQLARMTPLPGNWLHSFTACGGIQTYQYLTGYPAKCFAAGSGDTAPLDTMLSNTSTAPYPLCPGDPGQWKVAIIKDAMMAVVMLGTNDTWNGARTPEMITADLGTIIDKLVIADIMPLISTIPPFEDYAGKVTAINTGIRALAEAKAVPMIDFYEEIMRRRPGDTWKGTLISADGCHPTSNENGAYQDPLANLSYLSDSGYTLRGFLAFCKIDEVRSKVIENYNGGLAITTASLPGGIIAVAYTPLTLTAAGGAGPLSWSAAGLPGGMVLSPGGILSGTPAAAGVFSLNVSVTDGTSTTSRVLGLTVASGSPPETLTLDPVMDAYTNDGEPTANYGSADKLYTVGSNSINRRSMLLQFDLAGIPAGAVISSAVLRAACDNDGGYDQEGSTVQIRALQKAWTENGVSHQKRNGSDDWTGGAINSGANWSVPYVTVVNHAAVDGDGKANPYHTAGLFPAGDDWTGAYITFDVTVLVTDWQDGTVTNNGFALGVFSTVPDPSDLIQEYYGYAGIRWLSRESAASHPQLVVTFTDGGGTAMPQISVTAPAAGRSFFGRQDVTITWTSTGFSGNVGIDFYDGASWQAVAAGMADSGTYAWDVPNVDAAGAMIRVADAADGDPAGTGGTFTVVSITDADNDRMDDDWEVVQFGSLDNDGSGDADGDTLSDLQEFWLGTDPNTASGLARPEPGGCMPARTGRPTSLFAAGLLAVFLTVCRRSAI